METLSTLWQLDTLGRAMDHLDTSTKESLRLQNFIDNNFLDCVHTSEWITSRAPGTGGLLLEVPRSPANVVEYAINVASRAFPAWSQETPQQRSDVLFRIASIMEQKKEMFAVWESIDQGKPVYRARAEVGRSIEHFRYFARYILHDEKTAVRLNNSRAEGRAEGPAESTLTYKDRVPVGVYAIVTSSNMPLYLLTSKIAPCLAFGCTGVAKPSDLASMTAFLLAEVLRQAKVPAGVMNIVFGDADAGSTLVRSHLVRGVSFSGGTRTGIQIRNDTLVDIHKHLSLDLRGISPTIVFGDVNIDEAAAAAAYAAFQNSGQLCLSGSQIFVHQSIFKRFLPALIRRVNMNYRSGKELGPVVSQEHYAKIRHQLVQASEEHARFEVGGIPDAVPENGFLVKPTVLSDVCTNSLLAREGIFGPVAIVYPFDSEEDLVRLCNDNPNVVGALVLTDDLPRISRIGEHLDATLVWGGCWLGRELGAGLNDIRATGTGWAGGARTPGRVYTSASRACSFLLAMEHEYCRET